MNDRSDPNSSGFWSIGPLLVRAPEIIFVSKVICGSRYLMVQFCAVEFEGRQSLLICTKFCTPVDSEFVCCYS